MVAAPQHIRAHSATSVLELVWNEANTVQIPFHELRCACPCARCINEFTGERILKPEHVRPDVKPASLAMSGNYALKIHWSDGHDSGIYTWELLRTLRSP